MKFVNSPLFMWVIGALVVGGYLLRQNGKTVRTDIYPDISKDKMGEGTLSTPFISMDRSVVPNPVYPRGPMMVSKV